LRRDFHAPRSITQSLAIITTIDPEEGPAEMVTVRSSVLSASYAQKFTCKINGNFFASFVQMGTPGHAALGCKPI
jgi:hypothetical protein